MKRSIVLVGTLLGLLSCATSPRLGQGLGFGDFGERLQTAVMSGFATILTASLMCDRTEPGLLSAAGESSEFGAGFTCPTAPDSGGGRRYHLVGIADAQAGLRGGFARVMAFPTYTANDLSKTCETLRTAIRELTPRGGDAVRSAVYLSTAECPVGDLVRLDFSAAVPSEGKIVVTCDSASLVPACDVQFVQPPGPGRAAPPTSP